MIEGFIFDFDNTVYDYAKCNNNCLSKLFDYMHVKYNINKILIKEMYEKINNTSKKENNYSNKFNKSIPSHRANSVYLKNYSFF